MAGRNGGDSDACTRLTMSTTHNTSSKLCLGKSRLDIISINDPIQLYIHANVNYLQRSYITNSLQV